MTLNRYRLRSAENHLPGRRWWSVIVPSGGTSGSRCARTNGSILFTQISSQKMVKTLIRYRLRSAENHLPGRRWWSVIVPSGGTSGSRCARTDGSILFTQISSRKMVKTMNRYRPRSAENHLPGRRWWSVIFPSGGTSGSRYARTDGSILFTQISSRKMVMTLYRYRLRSAENQLPGRRWWRVIVPSGGTSGSRNALVDLVNVTPKLRDLCELLFLLEAFSSHLHHSRQPATRSQPEWPSSEPIRRSQIAVRLMDSTDN